MSFPSVLNVFRKYLCLLAAVAFFLTGCDFDSQEEISWRLQSHAVETSIDFIELKKFAENIDSMSNGRFKISVHAGGAIVGGAKIFSAVRDGEVEMGNGWPNWWSAQHPAWAVMNAGPFDFMNIDASMMFFLAGDGTDLANELAKPAGIIWRPAWWPGMEFGLLSKEPILGLDDLEGKKVRIGPGLPSEVLAEAAGSYAVPLVPTEIEPALRAGNLDAVEWTTTSGAWDLGLNEISPYAIVPAIWQPSVVSDFLINKQAYDKLPDNFKAMLETAIKAYTLSTTFKAKLKDIDALEKFRNAGTQISTWSAPDIERWRAANEKVLKRYREQDPYTKRLLDKKSEFKKIYNDYYRVFGPYD
jgi:TRAP-type mannitol/chloroaromatic compound transport system substrate-binding protein